jgi:hypothetical protein
MNHEPTRARKNGFTVRRLVRGVLFRALLPACTLLETGNSKLETARLLRHQVAVVRHVAAELKI